MGDYRALPEAIWLCPVDHAEFYVRDDNVDDGHICPMCEQVMVQYVRTPTDSGAVARAEQLKRALLLACGGDERAAVRFVMAADGEDDPSPPGGGNAGA